MHVSLRSGSGSIAAGAYGLQIRGIEATPELAEAPQSWPELHVAQTHSANAGTRSVIRDDRATVVITPEMRAEIDRATRTATLVSSTQWPAGALVHPFLAAPAALFAWWEGREALHGGAFANAAGTWAVLAEKGGGKSTTLGHLATTGVTVIADDLVIVDRGTVFAGPRCVDLTESAARALGVGELRDDARTTKARLLLGPAPAETRLAGIVHLAWGDEVAIERVPPRARAERLARHRTLRQDTTVPGGLLDLIRLPTYELRRPQRHDALDAVAAALRALPS
jgi:hypothetical protein